MSAVNDLPQGKRFSHVYLGGGSPMRDSARMRVRLATLYNSLPVGDGTFQQYRLRLQGELGVEIGYFDMANSEFLKKCELRDVLDTVTIVHKMLGAMSPSAWRDKVAEIFAQENLGYTVDAAGGVHLKVDPQFQMVVATAVAGLGAARFSAARKLFEDGQSALDRQPPDGRTAIRETFEAVEIVFKLFFPAASRLTAGAEINRLRPIITQTYNGNQPAIDAANLQLKAFEDWVNAAHIYRHGQAVEEPAPPPLSLALNMIGNGASYLRWLLDLGVAAAL